MVRTIFSLALLACLAATAARAQATADQLNKLSLEALTAPPGPGSIVDRPRASHHAATRHGHVASAASHPSGHSWHRTVTPVHWTHRTPARHAAPHKPSPYTPKFYRR